MLVMLVANIAYCAPGLARSPAQSVPASAPQPKSAPASSAPKATDATPTPDIWSDSEIADAKRVCTDALIAMAATVQEMAPLKNGRCGAPAPIRLISIGKINPVIFKPAPTLNCRMLVPLKRWIDTALQPMADRHLGARVATVSVMSSYSCRTRYGRQGARMSEHAFANALDIGGFHLANGTKISVLKDWGPTANDLAKALARAKATAKTDTTPTPSSATGALRNPASAKRPTKRPARPSAQPDRNLSAAPRDRPTQHRSPLPAVRIPDQTQPRDALRRDVIVAPLKAPRPPKHEGRWRRQAPPPSPTATAMPPPSRGTPFQRRSADRTRAAPMPPPPVRRPLRTAVRGQPKLDQSPARASKFRPPSRLGGPKGKGATPASVFLRGVHQSACRIFGTTLGPEANEAHRNHFHIDMFPRRRQGYCE